MTGINRESLPKMAKKAVNDYFRDLQAGIDWRLKLTYAATKRLVDIVERGLDALTETERRVLELFYIKPAKGNVERLMSELGYEKAQIYCLKDNALSRFTTALYGLPEY